MLYSETAQPRNRETIFGRLLCYFTMKARLRSKSARKISFSARTRGRHFIRARAEERGWSTPMVTSTGTFSAASPSTFSAINIRGW